MLLGMLPLLPYHLTQPFDARECHGVPATSPNPPFPWPQTPLPLQVWVSHGVEEGTGRTVKSQMRLDDFAQLLDAPKPEGTHGTKASPRSTGGARGWWL